MGTSYNPSVWADILQGQSELVQLSSSILSLCETNILLNTLSKLLTVEGTSELAARMAGSLLFELPDVIAQFTAAKTLY